MAACWAGGAAGHNTKTQTKHNAVHAADGGTEEHRQEAARRGQVRTLYVHVRANGGGNTLRKCCEPFFFAMTHTSACSTAKEQHHQQLVTPTSRLLLRFMPLCFLPPALPALSRPGRRVRPPPPARPRRASSCRCCCAAAHWLAFSLFRDSFVTAKLIEHARARQQRQTTRQTGSKVAAVSARLFLCNRCCVLHTHMRYSAVTPSSSYTVLHNTTSHNTTQCITRHNTTTQHTPESDACSCRQLSQQRNVRVRH